MHKSTLFSALVALASVQGKVRKFEIINKCQTTIWPGTFNSNETFPITSAGGSGPVKGFKLPPGASKTLSAPDTWGGRIWPRTKCKKQDGKFVCESGDCEGTDENCGTTGQTSTLGEFTLASEVHEEDRPEKDWYNLSLVDGFNVPMEIMPSADACPTLTCSVDLLASCPKELIDSNGSVCSSACKKGFTKGKYLNATDGNIIDGDRNCCSGPYNIPGACTIDMIDYYDLFKEACPEAYAYAYDDQKSLEKCASKLQPDYTITFCPASGGTQSPTAPPANDAKPPAPPAAQPSTAPGRKRALSLHATNVCVPAGFSLVSGGGDVQPQGDCIPQAGEQTITDAKEETSANIGPEQPLVPTDSPDAPADAAAEEAAKPPADSPPAGAPANNDPPASEELVIPDSKAASASSGTPLTAPKGPPDVAPTPPTPQAQPSPSHSVSCMGKRKHAGMKRLVKA